MDGLQVALYIYGHSESRALNTLMYFDHCIFYVYIVMAIYIVMALLSVYARVALPGLTYIMTSYMLFMLGSILNVCENLLTSDGHGKVCIIVHYFWNSQM